MLYLNTNGRDLTYDLLIGLPQTSHWHNKNCIAKNWRLWSTLAAQKQKFNASGCMSQIGRKCRSWMTAMGAEWSLWRSAFGLDNHISSKQTLKTVLPDPKRTSAGIVYNIGASSILNKKSITLVIGCPGFFELSIKNITTIAIIKSITNNGRSSFGMVPHL